MTDDKPPRRPPELFRVGCATDFKLAHEAYLRGKPAPSSGHYDDERNSRVYNTPGLVKRRDDEQGQLFFVVSGEPFLCRVCGAPMFFSRIPE